MLNIAFPARPRYVRVLFWELLQGARPGAPLSRFPDALPGIVLTRKGRCARLPGIVLQPEPFAGAGAGLRHASIQVPGRGQGLPRFLIHMSAKNDFPFSNPQAPAQNCLLHMQAVFSFVKDDRMGAVHDL